MRKSIEDLYLALGMELRKVNGSSLILWWCLRCSPGKKKKSLLHRKAMILMQIHLSFWTSEVMIVCLILLSKEMI